MARVGSTDTVEPRATHLVMSAAVVVAECKTDETVARPPPAPARNVFTSILFSVLFSFTTGTSTTAITTGISFLSKPSIFDGFILEETRRGPTNRLFSAPKGYHHVRVVSFLYLGVGPDSPKHLFLPLSLSSVFQWHYSSSVLVIEPFNNNKRAVCRLISR